MKVIMIKSTSRQGENEHLTTLTCHANCDGGGSADAIDTFVLGT